MPQAAHQMPLLGRRSSGLWSMFFGSFCIEAKPIG
jgi:hypothetical protein